jgi:cytoskeletal protein CcmA (bactofilin family)
VEENKEPDATSLDNDDVTAADAANASSAETTTTTSSSNTQTSNDAPKKPVTEGRLQGLIASINIYLLLFILILVLAAGIVFVGYQRSKKQAAVGTISTQTLDESTIEEISGSDSKIGDPKQTLTVESNAVFSGKVLVRDSLDVAGGIKVGGSVNLPGITVSGVSNFDQINLNKLTLNGDGSVQGTFSVQKTLSVSGGATFGGAISAPQLTIQTLILSGDIQLNRHIDAGGSTPGQTTGTALGSGGTASVSGTDTAGTVAINTGSNTASGCFITITFAQKFNSTPHIVITPVGSDAASMDYYVTRTSTSLSICTASAAPAGKSFAFDYIAID